MKYVSLIIVLICSQAGSAQSKPTGIYRYGNDYLSFLTDTTLEFYMQHSCCLLENICGYGKYKIENNRINVQTSRNGNQYSSDYVILGSAKSTTSIEIYIKERRRKARIVLTRWPWRWKRFFEHTHEARPKLFTRT